jgi:hypothetical protein
MRYTFPAMKTSFSRKQRAVSRALTVRLNVHSAALPYWEKRIEFHLYHGKSAASTLSLVTVEFVTNLIARSLTGAKDKRQSKGGNPDAGGLAVPAGQSWREVMETLLAQSTRAKKGHRKTITLSPLDLEEISGGVSLVIATRGGFHRKISSDDIGECFRFVEGADCLNLNRRWKVCEDSEKSLGQLSIPSYDMEEEKERILAMSEKLENCQACIDAAFKVDGSRQREGNRKQAIATLVAIVTRKQSGNGINKRNARLERATFSAYLQRGAIALQADRLKSAPWQFDLVTALQAVSLNA